MKLATGFINNAGVARAEPGSFLSYDAIREVAPSVFATEAHESRSERYGFISTAQILPMLADSGFFPVMATQSRVKEAGKREYTKHLLRFRKEADIYSNEGEVPEAILTNSHGGTASSFQTMAGMLRLACLNGMVAVSGPADEFRIRHTRNAPGQVIEGIYSILSNADSLVSNVGEMKAITLSTTGKQELAKAAALVKWGEEEKIPVHPDQLLVPKRWEDRDSSLWTTFNVVQENLIRGTEATWRNRRRNGRRMSNRAVTGVDSDLQLNKGLWALAEFVKANKDSFAAR